MRIRRLFVVAALATTVLALWASPASAAVEIEGAEFDTHYEEECVALLIEGGKVGDCHEAPHPLLPDAKEFIWGGLAFLVLFAILGKFAFPALKQAMKDREDKIRDDLEGAEQAKTDAETTKAEYERQLADSRIEAGRIIEEARSAADEVRKDLIAQAESDAADVRTRAETDAGLIAERAMADLRGNVTELSIELAEKVVERNLDADTQRALIDSYIDQVGTSN